MADLYAQFHLLFNDLQPLWPPLLAEALVIGP